MALRNNSLTYFAKVSSFAKRAVFQLEPCICFQREGSKWFLGLINDQVYLNAVVYSVQLYFSLGSNNQSSVVGHNVSQHFLEALRLLRERLSEECSALSIPDTTLMAVIALAQSALIHGRVDTSRDHVIGLRKIIEVRGGTGCFIDQPKILIETFR